MKKPWLWPFLVVAVATSCQREDPRAEGSLPANPDAFSLAEEQASLRARIDRPVILQGVYGGYGKDGPYVMVGDEGISLRLYNNELLGKQDNIGRPVLIRGTLRHTGDTTPPGCEDGLACPIQAAAEGFFLDEATFEFLPVPPPPLAGQLGHWVVLRGELQQAKAGTVVVTEGGPVYLEGHLDQRALQSRGVPVLVWGVLERRSAPEDSRDSAEPAARVTDHYFVTQPNVQFVE
jgi:hypothetical protein